MEPFCDICSKPIDLTKPHVFALNDVLTEAPMHEECYWQAVEVGNLDREGHFVWPPHDSEQHDGYREFLGFLQERVETLPPTEETREPNQLPASEELV